MTSVTALLLQAAISLLLLVQANPHLDASFRQQVIAVAQQAIRTATSQLGTGPITTTTTTATAPHITSTDAKAAENFEMDAGGSASIYGRYLAGNDLGTTRVFIGGIPATVLSVSDNRLAINVPSSLQAGQSYDMYVSNVYGTSNVVRVRILSNITTTTTQTIIVDLIANNQYDSDKSGAFAHMSIRGNSQNKLVSFWRAGIVCDSGVYVSGKNNENLCGTEMTLYSSSYFDVTRDNVIWTVGVKNKGDRKSSATFYLHAYNWNAQIIGSDTEIVTLELASPSTVTFSTSPQNGQAPLHVNFRAGGLSSGFGYALNFGDGSPTVALNTGCNVNTSCDGTTGVAGHDYTVAGTYTATLSKWVDGGQKNLQTISAVTITVTPVPTTTTTIPGDCNGDGQRNIIDQTALNSELFDGDGDAAQSAASGSFRGTPQCDANQDTQINAADLVCLGLLLGGQSCATPQAAAPNPPRSVLTLDIDNNGRLDSNTDGILVARHLAGFLPADVVAGALGAGATRTSASDIASYLSTLKNQDVLDADGNGTSDTGSDGVIIGRYMEGWRNEVLARGALGTGARRTTAQQITDFLDQFTPMILRRPTVIAPNGADPFAGEAQTLYYGGSYQIRWNAPVSGFQTKASLISASNISVAHDLFTTSATAGVNTYQWTIGRRSDGATIPAGYYYLSVCEQTSPTPNCDQSDASFQLQTSDAT